MTPRSRSQLFALGMAVILWVLVDNLPRPAVPPAGSGKAGKEADDRSASRQNEREVVFERARQRMEEKRYWGVLLLVPEDREGRRELGEALERLYDLPAQAGPELALLLKEAVYVCVRAEGWPVETGHDAILLDHRGQRVTSARLDPSRSGFGRRLRSLLCDEGRSASRAAL